ncbi:hypothetical protein [Sulfobacillus harzensis]|uniref:hypothetical protein n=1 Tax=Sulfobacillus harzensis TaxID=2729629 RepID=UPI001A9BC616|nr:hypothetical protein [Sulfobacillus harzensis]
MSIAINTDQVQHLINEFVTVSRQQHAHTWRLWELARAIYDVGGPTGLHRLAEATHYSYSTLRRWATEIVRFPPAVRARFASVSPDLFRTADWGRRQFSVGRPEATLEHWLSLVATENLTRNTLQARIVRRRDQLQLEQDATGQARQQQLLHIADRALAAAANIERQAEEFNAKYKAYALFTLNVTRVPYVP